MSARIDAAIIDSGGANLASLQYALDRLGVRSLVSDQPAVIAAAARVLLPGVGAAGAVMRRLRASGLDRLIPALHVPLLGICLGMQLLFERSDEDATDCLGVIPGRIERLQPAPARPVPHMGWNTLELRRADPLLAGIHSGERVYFVHGYAARADDAALATTHYGDSLAAAVRRGNFYGVQFHPERSAAVGAQLLRNFLAL